MKHYSGFVGFGGRCTQLANYIPLVLYLEMVVPEVDQKLLEELEGMGFPKAKATRALHFSGEGIGNICLNCASYSLNADHVILTYVPRIIHLVYTSCFWDHRQRKSQFLSRSSLMGNPNYFPYCSCYFFFSFFHCYQLSSTTLDLFRESICLWKSFIHVK